MLSIQDMLGCPQRCLNDFIWLLAGIQQVEGGAGYQELVLRPMVPWREQAAGLTRLGAERDTPLGKIVSSWRRVAEGALEYNATVPPLATATILVPTIHLGRVVITEGIGASARAVWKAGRFVPGVPGLRSAAVSHLSSAVVAFSVGSGAFSHGR